MRIYQPHQRTEAEGHARKVRGDLRLDGHHGYMFVTESASDARSLEKQAAPENIEERYPLLGRFFR